MTALEHVVLERVHRRAHRGIDGGETKLTNLVLLCSHHHHVTHKPGWSMTFHGTTLEVLRPNGTGFR